MRQAVPSILDSQGMPVRLRHLGNQKLTNGSGSSSWTFSAFNAGGNGLGSTTVRKQIFIVAWSVSGVLSNLMSGCSIAGGGTSSVGSVSNAGANLHLASWKASVSATSGNIVISSGGFVVEVNVSVYEILDANTTVLDTGFSYNPGSGVMSDTLTTKGGGCAISAASILTASPPPSIAWTNATQDYSTGHGSSYGLSVASTKQTPPTSQTYTATTNGNGGTDNLALYASFQPLQ